ncbi:hypothetical protein [Luteibacter aegosomatissinici]|uniref:hypothetical protein n=1 Tax=Luteibacter aegosomatissinici TaxID=2911539 RepID=UPI001FFACE94|nr:hypothetical protein [Luteibacter aegosomatissinici]UPG94998.1 hypothetical protein L2Y97_02510 [Luteibacter aegosomatissinici]
MTISLRTLVVSLSFLSFGMGTAQAYAIHGSTPASMGSGHVATVSSHASAVGVECKNPIECSSRAR